MRFVGEMRNGMCRVDLEDGTGYGWACIRNCPRNHTPMTWDDAGESMARHAKEIHAAP